MKFTSKINVCNIGNIFDESCIFGHFQAFIMYWIIRTTLYRIGVSHMWHPKKLSAPAPLEEATEELPLEPVASIYRWHNLAGRAVVQRWLWSLCAQYDWDLVGCTKCR